ncbi:hypothetical protein [Streptomyces sp. NPDC053079]|uniref:hypothetical protein n=1 Tax=Streptomyces sp. NPDC053079 TaxID=3365697 RepID=UPI0037D0F1E8
MIAPKHRYSAPYRPDHHPPGPARPAHSPGLPPGHSHRPAAAPGIGARGNGVWDIPLVRLVVRPQAGAITPADLSDERLYTGWGIILSRSQSRPVPGYSGQLLYESDTGRLRLHATIDDTAGPDATWRTIADTGAAITPYSVATGLEELSATGSYGIAGANLVYIELSMTVEKSFTLTGRSLRPNLPFTAATTGRKIIDGLRWQADQNSDPNITGCKLLINGGTTAGLYLQQNPGSAGDWNAEGIPFKAGDQVNFSGLYSVADGQL